MTTTIPLPALRSPVVRCTFCGAWTLRRHGPLCRICALVESAIAAVYGPPTRAELLELASIAHAYGVLVTEPSAAKALSKLRAALRAELANQQVSGGDRS